MSWRMLGAMIMVHGDDRGLRIPPKMAPIEVVIVPIVRGDSSGPVLEAARALFTACKRAGVRVKLDDREGQSPGFKFNEWDMRGVPLRIELGARDLEAGVATLVRRDRAFKEDGQKQTLALEAIVAAIPALLEDIQAGLFAQAKVFLDTHIVPATERATFLQLLIDRAGLVEIPWCERPACEAAVKDATSATTRNLHRPARGATCVACGEPATAQAFFAQSY
jgi:prolyl-tRNA synthetase